MIRFIREKFTVVLWIAILAFIGTIIFSWGMGGVVSSDPRREGVIANINGEKVKIDEFRKVEQQLINAKKKQDLTDVDYAEIKEQAWDRLVRSVLVQQQLKKYDIRVSKERLYNEILNNPNESFKAYPQFQENGVFSLKKYQDFIKNPDPKNERMYRAIEEYYKSFLPSLLLEEKITSSILITDAEAKQDYEDNNLKAKAKYLKVDTKDYEPADSLITESEIKAYYDKNISDFPEMPEKRNYDYVLFKLATTKKDSQRTYDDILYAKEQLKFNSFEDVAQTLSEDKASAERGGDLGFFGRKQMVKEFENAAFNAKVGEVVGPIKTQYGYHLIKVTDVQKDDQDEKTKVKASHILIKFKIYPETRDEVKYLASNFRDDLYEAGFLSQDFDKLAKKFKQEIKTADFMTEGYYTKEFGKVPELGSFLFNNPTGTVSSMLVSDKGYLFVRVKDIEKKRKKTTEELKKQIVFKIKQEKGLQKAYDELVQYASTVKDTADFNLLSKEKGFVSKTTKEFTRNSYIAGIGKDLEFTKVAFATAPNSFSAPFKGEKAAYMLYLLRKDQFSEEAFKAKEANIKKRMEDQRKNQLLTAWMDNIKAQAKIEDYRDLYYR